MIHLLANWVERNIRENSEKKTKRNQSNSLSVEMSRKKGEMHLK